MSMFNFSLPNTQTPVQPFNFGQSTPLPQTSLSQTTFGSNIQPAFGLTTPQTSFTPANPSAFGTTFGATAFSSAGLTSFGTPAAMFTFPNTSQAPQSTFSFNTNLGVNPSIQPLGSSLQQPQPLSVPSTTSNDANRGLGGEGTSVGQTNANNKSVKDQHLPPEINSLVESFKNFMKEQKMIRDENAQPRFSFKPIVEINTELDDVLRIQLERLQVVLQKNKKTVDSLKHETSSLVSDAETAHRALKSEGISSMSYALGPDKYVTASTTLEYFSKMVDQFEDSMKTYSRQIKELEIHLDYLHKPFQTQDLLMVVKKQHEALVALAAEIYGLHETLSRDLIDHTDESSPMITGKTINIGDDPFSLTERPICKPIAFPTFSIQKTNQSNTTQTATNTFNVD